MANERREQRPQQQDRAEDREKPADLPAGEALAPTDDDHDEEDAGEDEIAEALEDRRRPDERVAPEEAKAFGEL